MQVVCTSIAPLGWHSLSLSKVLTVDALFLSCVFLSKLLLSKQLTLMNSFLYHIAPHFYYLKI
jgi:hypothetical protein